jgi:hypothetical protein
MRNAFRILVEIPEGKRQFGSIGSRWGDNINKDVKDIVCKEVDWTHLAQDRYQWRALVNTIINFGFRKAG